MAEFNVKHGKVGKAYTIPGPYPAVIDETKDVVPNLINMAKTGIIKPTNNTIYAIQ